MSNDAEKDPINRGQTPATAADKTPDRILGFKVIGQNPDGTPRLANSTLSTISIPGVIELNDLIEADKREAGDTRPAPDNETEAQAIERVAHDDRGGNKSRGKMKEAKVRPTSRTGRIQEWVAAKRGRKIFKRASHGYWRDRAINGYGEAPNVVRAVNISGKYQTHEGTKPDGVPEAMSDGDASEQVRHIYSASQREHLTAEEHLGRAREHQAEAGHVQTDDSKGYPANVKHAKKMAKHERVDQRKINKQNRKSDKWAEERTKTQIVVPAMENAKIAIASGVQGARNKIIKTRIGAGDKAVTIARKSPVKIRKKNRPQNPQNR